MRGVVKKVIYHGCKIQIVHDLFEGSEYTFLISGDIGNFVSNGHHSEEEALDLAKQYVDSMKEETIKLNESQLRNVVKKAIKKVLREMDANYEKDMWMKECLYGMSPEEAYAFIKEQGNTGNEVELDCGIIFGMGIYAYRDTCNEYLPGVRLRPNPNSAFVMLGDNLLKQYLKNAYQQDGFIH